MPDHQWPKNDTDSKAIAKVTYLKLESKGQTRDECCTTKKLKPWPCYILLHLATFHAQLLQPTDLPYRFAVQAATTCESTEKLYKSLTTFHLNNFGAKLKTRKVQIWSSQVKFQMKVMWTKPAKLGNRTKIEQNRIKLRYSILVGS